jgi:putative phosphoesterase
VRIAVISDTHLPRFGRALPEALILGIRGAGCELVLHLGDWTSGVAVGAVEALGLPFDGVAGNNDPPELVERFGRTKVIELDGIRIGLTHGDLGRGRTTPERARRTFEGEPLAAILFGHSHIPMVEWLPRPTAPRGGLLLLNPGSPTDRRRQPRATWAVLELHGRRVSADIRVVGPG